MNILAIDTSTSWEIVAVCSGDTQSDATQSGQSSHSMTLFNNIDQALAGVKMTIENLDLIGVGIGPGSFTGIRIAVSTARMLGQLLAIPVVGITSHLIFASSIQCGIGDNIIIASDAKKGRVFGGIYKQSAPGTIPIEVVKPGDYQIDHLLGHINPSFPTHSFGDGIERYIDQIRGVIPGLLHHEQFKHNPASTCSIISMIYKQDPEAYRDINTVIPYYARRSDAEVARDGKP